MGKLDADFSTFFFFYKRQTSFRKILASDFYVLGSYMERLGNSGGNKILAFESTKYIRRLNNETRSRERRANSKIKSARAEMVLLYCPYLGMTLGNHLTSQCLYL